MLKAALLLATAMTLVAQAPTRPDVSGTWVDQSTGSIKWVLTEKDGQMHVVETNGDKVETDFTCPLNGKECAVKQDGRSEKMMIYYNGDKLVEISEGHEGVSKKRLSMSADGKTLSVEIIPLASTDKTETMSFRRQTT
jgi:hypothetical protein